MKRITQSLFEEIQKVSSAQIEEKIKHDEDKDGDEDAADYMMKRRKAGGQSHAQAHAATRKHNEEAEQEDVEQLDEIGDTPAGKKALGSYVKKRTKQLPQIEVGYKMAQSDSDARMVNKYKKKVNKGIGRAVDRLTKEEAEIEEAWPGTAEYKAKHGTEKEKWEAKYGKSDAKKLEPYGYRGASGSETPETASDATKVGRGRKKMKEETIVKHEDFTITVVDNPTFKDFFDAARSYVVDADDAVIVAEAFHTNDDISIIIENDIRNIYKDTLDKYEKEGYIIEDFDIILDEDEAQLMYSLVKEDSETRRNYIHHGKVVVEQKGE